MAFFQQNNFKSCQVQSMFSERFVSIIWYLALIHYTKNNIIKLTTSAFHIFCMKMVQQWYIFCLRSWFPFTTTIDSWSFLEIHYYIDILIPFKLHRHKIQFLSMFIYIEYVSSQNKSRVEHASSSCVKDSVILYNCWRILIACLFAWLAFK